jgi:integrase
MPRPNKDGTPARAARRKRLNERFVQTVRGEAAAFAVWDIGLRGLCLRVQPTGQRSYKAVYSRGGRARWCHIGDASSVSLADARKVAAEIMLEVVRGKDPAADRRAERNAGTFAELAERYVEQHAKKRNKSWKHADWLVRKYLIPRWGKLRAESVGRADVKATMRSIEAPVLANQVLASASAIFSWGIKEDILSINPCRGVERNKTISRERVLSDAEIPLFWRAFDNAGLVQSAALKVLLLCGQRPGEVSSLRLEHLSNGWWVMPGQPEASTDWPGTKNGATHKIWLPSTAQAIIVELNEGKTTGFAFDNGRGRAVGDLSVAMQLLCKQLGVEQKVTPHDLRRTHGTRVAELGFGRDAMNRVQNHKEGGIASVYDRHQYTEENKRLMEAVAARILALAGIGDNSGKVVRTTFNR